MAEKGERLEISVAVRLTKDCDDAEVLMRASDAILDAQSHLLDVPGAKRLTGGYTIGPLVQRHHRMRRAAHGPRHTVQSANAEEPDAINDRPEERKHKKPN